MHLTNCLQNLNTQLVKRHIGYLFQLSVSSLPTCHFVEIGCLHKNALDFSRIGHVTYICIEVLL